MDLGFRCVVVAVVCGACGGNTVHAGDAPLDNGDGGMSPGGADSVGVDRATGGVALTPADGWVDGMSNPFGIQGAMYTSTDGTTQLTEDDRDGKICIKGTAALVDVRCTPVPPALDCFDSYFGAIVRLNLNQERDATTGELAEPQPYDASGIKAFAFTLDGPTLPGANSLRFAVEGGGESYCNFIRTPADAKEGMEDNYQFAFDDLFVQCWKTPHRQPATAVQSNVTNIFWQVVTNSNSTFPYDFCISHVRAITE